MTNIELKAYLDADNAWDAELVRLYGVRAGDVRYRREGKGAEGSELRRLYVARQTAMKAFEQAREKRRNAVPA